MGVRGVDVDGLVAGLKCIAAMRLYSLSPWFQLIVSKSCLVKPLEFPVV